MEKKKTEVAYRPLFTGDQINRIIQLLGQHSFNEVADLIGIIQQEIISKQPIDETQDGHKTD